jgi:hypothetical protein
MVRIGTVTSTEPEVLLTENSPYAPKCPASGEGGITISLVMFCPKREDAQKNKKINEIAFNLII